MMATSNACLRIGDWCVEPAAGLMRRDGETVRLDARTLGVLKRLAARPGEIVGIDELLDEVWSDVTVGQDSVYQAIATLRRLFGDDSREPRYFATVPRQGYRLVAAVSEIEKDPRQLVGAVRKRPAIAFLSGGVVLLVAALLATFLPHSLFSPAHAPVVTVQRNSIAVLPFIDLTSQAMSNEYLADGITEELIDRLSGIPGVRVPPPTASFYFKGKQVTVAEAARMLDVPLVLDGSLRQSGDKLRIAVRLIQGKTGYILWSQTTDLPAGNVLKVQDEIAGDVVKALGRCLEAHARTQ